MDDNSSVTAQRINQAIARELGVLDGCRLLAGEISPCMDALFPEEREVVARSVDRRRHEFATGRALARRIMQEMGLEPAPILRGLQRQPVWPDGVTGSLTHTESVAVAALAPADACRALGIDIEVADRVGPELHRRLFTRPELALIAGDSRLAGLVFSAKEAGFKATFALAPRFVGFQEAEIVVDPAQARFRFRYLGDHAASRVMEEGEGRFLFCERYVLSLFIIR